MADLSDLVVNGGLLVIAGLVAAFITQRYQKRKEGREIRQNLFSDLSNFNRLIVIIFENFKEYFNHFNTVISTDAQIKVIKETAIEIQISYRDIYSKFFIYFDYSKRSFKEIKEGMDKILEFKNSIKKYVDSNTIPESMEIIEKMSENVNDGFSQLSIVALFAKIKI